MRSRKPSVNAKANPGPTRDVPSRDVTQESVVVSRKRRGLEFCLSLLKVIERYRFGRHGARSPSLQVDVEYCIIIVSRVEARFCRGNFANRHNTLSDITFQDSSHNPLVTATGERTSWDPLGTYER